METPRVSRIPKKVIYFSLRDNHLLIKRHLSAGGTAYFVRNGSIIEAVGADEREMARISSIPAAMGGLAEFNVANAMAAAAAARSYGLDVEQVSAALMSFRSEEHNAGRTNLYRVGEGFVLLDYGHNPAALQSIARFATQWRGFHLTGIIGAPGDRSDELIEEIGRIAARGFNRVVIKEDNNLRGRAPGEVAQILLRTIKEEVPERDCFIILNELEALERQIRNIGPGEIVLVFYDEIESIQRVLSAYGAVPASSLEIEIERFDVAKA